MDASLLNSLGI